MHAHFEEGTNTHLVIVNLHEVNQNQDKLKLMDWKATVGHSTKQAKANGKPAAKTTKWTHMHHPGGETEPWQCNAIEEVGRATLVCCGAGKRRMVNTDNLKE